MSPPDLPREKVHIPGWVTIGIIVLSVAILAALSVPQITCGPVRGQKTQTVNNGRQIFIATFNMANDFEVNHDPHLGWPGDLSVSPTDPVHSLTAFVQRMTDYDYIKKGDLGKIFAAPDVKPYTPDQQFTAENSAFKIYLATKDDVSNVLFLATKNYTFSKPLDPAQKPYGETAFVIVRKGGDALSFGNKLQALSKTLGLMPGHTDPQDPGEETSANVWK